jgi:acyl-CoA reductase-like NAD-dependent aldehyde dehydrogenase
VTSPYDGCAIAEVETSGHAHVNHALATAEKLHRDWANWLPTHQRIAILERAADIMAD